MRGGASSDSGDGSLGHDNNAKINTDAEVQQAPRAAAEQLPGFADVNERKVLTKIDLRLVPALSLMYLLAFLDRTNIANAAVYGLAKDLKISPTSNDYNTALTLFFVPYVIFEIPSNIILKRLKPHVWLPLCMFGFGLVTVCQGLVTTTGGLYATRFFLGLCETGMFPGSFYLIGMWYKRAEAQKRFTFFFASTSLAGAFGGLIAAGINNINGKLGHESWSWIFIIEGAITMFFSFVLFFWIPDFPETAKFLSETERSFVLRRLQDDQGVQSGLDRKITLRDVVGCFKDWKIVIGGLMYFSPIIPAYSYAYFAPGIIQSFGFSAVQTQLHSVPPWACAWGWSMLIAWASDRFQNRIGFIVLSLCIGIIGFAMVLSNISFTAKYAALHLITSGVYGAMPIIVCWFNLNLGGHLRRSVGSAWQIGFGNIGGIIATYAFLAKDKPKYTSGLSICISFVCLTLVSCLIYLAGIMQANKKRAGQTNTALSEKEEKEEGDLAPGYRYMY